MAITITSGVPIWSRTGENPRVAWRTFRCDFATKPSLNFGVALVIALSSSSRSERHSGASPASACWRLIPGLSRPMMLSHRDRRLSRSFQPGVICAFIIMGAKTSGAAPTTRLLNPGEVTPTTVNG